ncbi:hypothetical protein SCO01_08250 [Staphylococcus cohnii subsp. cohnii]|nr:hypothetical protein SCO01_08250 [Staphylococcus cohnii subsp. cohnii]
MNYLIIENLKRLSNCYCPFILFQTFSHATDRSMIFLLKRIYNFINKYSFATKIVTVLAL